ncbi:MAG: GHKL domain-containing protein [bacterium]|nr:GHKL domain-containing protein [bacterium]MCM1375453.1 GHKL domain-containing protein [Muribaculum sp.]
MKLLFRDISTFWGMIHVILLFVMLFRSRYTAKKTIVLAGIGMGTLMLLNLVGVMILGFEVMGRLFLFTCSIPSFIFFYILSADKKARFLLTFCLADTSCLWIIAVTLLLDIYIGGGQYVLMLVSRLIAFPLLEYLAYRYLRRPYMELQDAVDKGWGIFAGMTLLYYLLLTMVIFYPTNIENRPEDVFLCILILVLMFFNYATIFTALYRQHLLYRRQQGERVLQEQKNALEAQLENQQTIRRLKHDMKGHAVTLSGLLGAGRTQEALEYLKKLVADTDFLWGQFCANPYMNAVFGYYVRKFQELDTELKLDIRIGEEELPYMELCQILSNGLENACDALEGLDADEREASVQMKYSRDYLIIRIKNHCREDLHVIKGTLPDTEKKEHGHGLGLITVQEAAQRLGGEMFCYTENGHFVMDVMVSQVVCQGSV